jgi:Tfp pilus assembly protein PilN
MIVVKVSGIGIALIGCHVILFLAPGLSQRKLAALQRQWQAVEAQKKEADAVLQELLHLKTDAQALEGVASQRILLARKLNQLSDLLPAGVWLTSLVYTQEGSSTLTIEGSAVATETDETKTVGRFIKALEGSQEFTRDVRAIELERTQRRKIKTIDVMDFTIKCSLKQPSG